MGRKSIMQSTGWKYVDWLCSLHPELNDVDPTDVEACERVSQEIYLNVDLPMARFAKSIGVDSEISFVCSLGGFVLVPIVQMCGMWRRSPHSYRFDKELVQAVADSSGIESVPVEAFASIPYDAFFVFFDYGELEGFFVWLDRTSNALSIAPLKRMEYTEREASLFRLGFGGRLPEHRLDLYNIDLSKPATVRQLVVEAIDDAGKADEECGRLSMELSLLAYICSENADMETVYAPPAGAGKRSKKGAAPETVHRVGAHVGRALGEARKAHASSSRNEGAGTSRAPYVRAAHWHHYWTGRRKGRTDGRFGDELVLRWIPPTFVGTGEPDEVLHEARAL